MEPRRSPLSVQLYCTVYSQFPGTKAPLTNHGAKLGCHLIQARLRFLSFKASARSAVGVVPAWW